LFSEHFRNWYKGIKFELEGSERIQDTDINATLYKSIKVGWNADFTLVDILGLAFIISNQTPI